MKKQLFVLFAFVASSAFYSFDRSGFSPLDITTKIGENTYMDKAEITNLHYREYVYWVAKEYGTSSKESLAAQLKTDIWEGEKFEAIAVSYSKLPKYNEYPVVGVSYEQAVAYCTWRADRINEYFKANKKKNAKKISCRLPSKAEWEKVALAEFKEKDLLNSKNFNVQHVSADGVLHEKGLTTPVTSLHATPNDFYNLIGNVAEMVSEKGIAKGASWQHAISEVDIHASINYSGPTNWLGFRCVLETK